MLESWRLLETGLASAARNIALSRALLEARHADESPSTLRFLRFAPSVLLGSRDSAAEELEPHYCAAEKIAVHRRITGGGSWYVDERQLGWELYLHRRDVGTVPLGQLSKRIGHAAATAISALDIDARYRARDDVEVDGRVVCSLACAAEGSGVLVQGLLLLDPNWERIARVLRSPASAPLKDYDPANRNEPDTAIAAVRMRMAGLKPLLRTELRVNAIRHNLAEAFESEFGVEFREGELTLTEHARYERALAEIDTGGWIGLVSRPSSNMPLRQSVHRVRGGVLRASLKYELSSRTIRLVWFSGDIALNPRRSLADLEAALRDVPLRQLEKQVERFFASRPVDRGLIEPRDFIAAVRLAAGEPLAA